MLKPASDRLDYGALLAPPVGYEVVSAVGTTYSLDLDALVGICISLGLAENTDSELMKSPIYLLEALRRTADKVVIFCEAGQIHAPSTCSPLYILFEKMVYEVALPKLSKKKFYPSFHPKFWLVKYKDSDGNLLYRTIILSRNLTFDRSWDISVCLDGRDKGNEDEKSLPVRDFFNFLAGFISGSDDNGKTKRKLISGLAREVVNVSFETEDNRFTDFNFIPVGIKGGNGVKYDMRKFPLFAGSNSSAYSFQEVLLMSPFLSADIIDEFNRRSRIRKSECTLITRRESLNKLKASQCDNFKIYTIKDTIVNGESTLSDVAEDADNPQKQDIHAKLYLWKNDSGAELYLGSLNASDNALNGNIEMMLRLCSKNRYINTSILTKDLFCGEPDNPNNPFELTSLPAEYETPAEDIGNALQQKIKELCRSHARASVLDNCGKYDIIISFDKLSDASNLTIGPLLSKKTVPVDKNTLIESLDVLQISCFYRVTAADGDVSVSRVIKIETENMPDCRESAAVTGIVKDKQCFIQYVAFLLGDNFLLSALEDTGNQSSGFFGNGKSIPIPALYEKMLKASANSPERFSGIDYLMKMAGDSDVIPDGFADLYEVFRKVVGLRD